MRALVFTLLCACFVFGQEDVLRETKRELIKLKQETASEAAIINRYDWLSDLTLGSSYTKDEEGKGRQDYTLSFSQDIFRFGGIEAQMRYGDELYRFSLLEIDKEKKEDLQALYNAKIDYEMALLKLEQNTLSIENSAIEVRHKHSAYKEGEIGISDLNDAIMTKNTLKDTKKELELSVINAINTLKLYTQIDAGALELPSVPLFTKAQYVEASLSVGLASASTQVSKTLYAIKKSEALPSVSLQTTYGYQRGGDVASGDYYNYGIAVSLPLRYTTSNTIAQSRLEYMQSQQELLQTRIEAELAYDTALATIENYTARKVLAHEDVALYQELLDMSLQEYEAGYKTMDDVTTLQNSKRVREIDDVLYQLYIEKEKLSLYFSML
jgi:outer membrane protein TolC